MQKREAKHTLMFRHWLREHPMGDAAFELKQTDTALPFSALREHQENALLAAKSNRGLLYKIPDDSRSYKPFDLFYLRFSEAYVVIFYEGVFCIIDIDEFIEERQHSSRKSLTKERAQEIATISVPL